VGSPKSCPCLVSFRIEERHEKQLDALASRRNTSRSEVLRWLLEATENHESLQVIEEAAYRRPAVLPEARRYRCVGEFRALVGIADVHFRKGAIIGTDSHAPEMISQLFARGARLEPLPD